jgi:hypothetical protein
MHARRTAAHAISLVVLLPVTPELGSTSLLLSISLRACACALLR